MNIKGCDGVNRIYEVPARLSPRYLPYIWGGTLLREKLGKDIPSDDIGESWEVSAHPRAESLIVSGPARGMAFGEYAVGPDFYGEAPFDKFPLLIKYLGAGDTLSVQVHPGDGNCRPGESGKAEAWVVIAAELGAELIYDINCTAEKFAQAVAAGRMAEKLRRVKVSPGDVLDIPAGTVGMRLRRALSSTRCSKIPIQPTACTTGAGWTVSRASSASCTSKTHCALSSRAVAKPCGNAVSGSARSTQRCC